MANRADGSAVIAGRQSVRRMPSRIWASVGFGVVSSNTLAVSICPFWQKPHAGTCSSSHACWMGCSTPSFERPSSVVISTFAACDTGLTHERTASPPMSTVQAPHWPRPHPNFGPSSPRSLRST